MARQREFDETEVLDRAVACFWQAGYQATSVRDLAARLAELEAFFARLLHRARQDGSLPAGRDPDAIARLLLAVIIGIRVRARARPERALFEGLLRPALALLDDDHPVHPPLTQGEAT